MLLGLQQIVLGVSAVFSLILLVYLIRLSKRVKKYIPLAVFTALICLEVSIRLLSSNSIITDFPHFLYINEPFAMLYGLLIYIYARNQSYTQLHLLRSDIRFLIPFFLSLLAYLPFYFAETQAKLAEYNLYKEVKFDISTNVWEWLFDLVINGSFLWAANVQLKKFAINVKEQTSSIVSVDLRLSQFIIKACLGLYLIELTFVYMTYYGFPYHKELFVLLDLLKPILLLLIGYDAITSNKAISDLEHHWAETNQAGVNMDGQLVKYSKSTLNKTSSLELLNQLETYMQTEQPFLNPKLRISDLAEKTEIPSHHISQVINEQRQQNFYEFVNGYRIDLAKELLLRPQFENYTFDAIGFEVGFNSKSAFYTSFKKITGTTPARFKKEIKH